MVVAEYIPFWVWALLVLSAAGQFLVVPDMWPQIKKFFWGRK